MEHHGPSSSRPIVTQQAVQLSINVNQADWFGQFDSLDVFRSRTSEAGPYDALTGDTWSVATLPLGAPTVPPSPPQTGPSVNLVGLTLIFLVNSVSTVTVTFTGTDPTTFHTAATQIASQSLGLLNSFVSGNVLVVQTVASGPTATLQLTGGTAAAVLGLSTTSPTNTAFGAAARIPLLVGQSNYLFTDLNGSNCYWYRTRFYNSSLAVSSASYSLPFQGLPLTGISPNNLVLATIDLVDMRGKPTINQSVILFNRFAGTTVQGKTVIGDPLSYLTDKNGHAEFLIVRGIQFTVAVSGTDLVRDITAPTDPTVTSFSLLDPAYGSNDLFNVQVPDLHYAVRQSL